MPSSGFLEPDQQLVVDILVLGLLVSLYLSAARLARLPSLHDEIFISQDDSDLRSAYVKSFLEGFDGVAVLLALDNFDTFS